MYIPFISAALVALLSLLFSSCFMGCRIQSHTLVVVGYLSASLFGTLLFLSLLASSSHEGQILEKLLDVVSSFGRNFHESEPQAFEAFLSSGGGNLSLIF